MGKTVQEENRLDTEGTESHVLFPQRCRLSGAGALKHRTQNQGNGSDKDKTAHPEEPSPAKAQGNNRGEHLPKNSSRQERSGHCTNSSCSPSRQYRFREIRQGDRCKSGGSHPLAGPQNSEHTERRSEGASKGSEGKHAQGENHNLFSSVTIRNRSPYKKSHGVSKAEAQRQGERCVSSKGRRDRGEQRYGSV